MKILLVEDDPSTVEVYKTAFEAAGFEVETLFSGDDAMARVKEIEKGKAEKPDLILLDYVLPGPDGVEILKEIRKNKNTKNLKVFITTNYSIEQLKKKKKVVVEGERFILKADYPPSKMTGLVQKELK